MASTTGEALKGGSFLIDDLTPEQLYTPEDITDEQKLMAKTTEDYIKKEVLPHIETLEKQDLELTKKLLKKAGDLGLLGSGCSRSLWRDRIGQNQFIFNH